MMRAYHPSYEKLGGVPGIEEVRLFHNPQSGMFRRVQFLFHCHSIKGVQVTSRSEESVLTEAQAIDAKSPTSRAIFTTWAGRRPISGTLPAPCRRQHGLCQGKKCLAPKPCPEFAGGSHGNIWTFLRGAAGSWHGVKKVFIRSVASGLIICCADPDDSFFRELVQHHVSGQLKVAPEHCSAAVLDKMGKPHIEAYIEFSRRYFTYTGRNREKEQYLVPYLMTLAPRLPVGRCH